MPGPSRGSGACEPTDDNHEEAPPVDAPPSGPGPEEEPASPVRPGGGRPAGAADLGREVGGRDLPVAIVVGVVLAGIFLGSLFWHPLAFTVVVGLLCLLAYVEAGQVLRSVGMQLQVPVLLVATLVMLAGAYHARHTGQMVGLVVLFLGGVLWLLADSQRRDAVRGLAVTMLFGIWVGLLASFAVLLRVGEGGTAAALAVIGAAIFTDIGGYAVGAWKGRRPVAPSVSPNKTWEGLLGGLALSALLAVLVLPNVGDLFTPLTAAVLAVVCGLAGFLGDLVESMLKRDLGIKDLGELLPGHGGVLDRVDGILMALPVGYYAVAVLTQRAG